MKKLKLLCVMLTVLSVLSFSSCSCEKKPDVREFPDEPEIIVTAVPPTKEPENEKAEETKEPDSLKNEEIVKETDAPKVSESGEAEQKEPEASGEEKIEMVEEPTKGYNIIKEKTSPDGRHTAYIFKRKSPTTGTQMYNLSVLKTGERLTGEEGNAFSIDYLFDIKWGSESSLLVSVKSVNEIGLVQEDKVGGIDIFYGVIQ